MMAQQQKTILIVDEGLQDEKRYRNCLLEEREYSYSIVEERSAEGALALCRGQLPDGILVDFWLPDVDGLEFIEKLKKQTGSKCPPVVMISDREDTSVAVKAIKSGAEDYLIKQKTTPDELRSAVRSAIENAELRQKLQYSEQRFRTSVENMLDCFGIYAAMRDESGKIVDFRIEYLNAAALENNRMTPEQIGQKLCELLPAHKTSGLFEEYCRVVETGQPLIKESLIYGDVFNGQEITKAYDIRVSKWNDGFVAAWRDVSDRKQTEAALHRAYAELENRAADLTETNQNLQMVLQDLQVFQEELNQQNSEMEMAREQSELERQRYQDLFNFAPDGYLVTDNLGIIQEANRTAAVLLAANQEFMIGKPLGVFVSRPARSVFRTQLNQLVAAINSSQSLQEMQTWELSLKPVKGKSFAAEISVAPAYNLAGEATGLRWLIRDITKRQQAQKQLQASRELIGQIADTTPGILYLYDLVEQRNVYVNRQVTELLGYSTEQIQAMGANLFPTLIHPEDLAGIPAHLERLSSAPEGTILEQEYRMRRANGEWRWFYSREVVFSRNADGSLHQVLGTVLDITERKQAEIELSRANERYELAAVAVNCLIYDWDLQSNKVERTRGLTELLGYAPEEAEPTVQWWSDRIHPEDLQQIKQQKIDVSLTTIDRYCKQYRVRHKNGHYLWIEDRGFVVRDKAGRPVRIVGSTTDISDRKQAEAALKQSETRLKQLVELNLLGVIFWDIDGTVIDANNAFLNMVGYTREDLQAGRVNWRAITPPEQLDWSERSLQQMRHKNSSTLEKEYIRKDGSRVPVLLGGVMFEDSQSRGVSFVVDLSERKQLEDELRRRERQFSKLVENLPDVVFRLTPDLRHLYISPCVEQLSGIAPQNFIGKTGRELGFAEDICDLFEEKCREASATKQVIPMEFSNNGRYFYSRIIPEYAPDGSLESLMGITEEISDRKRTEQTLHIQAQILENLTEGAIMADENGIIALTNPAFDRMFGYARGELQGKSVLVLNDLPPEENIRVTNAILETVKSQGNWSGEFNNRKKDGTKFITTVSIGRLDVDGKIYFIGVQQDISDRKKAEQALHENVAILNAINEATPILIYVKDRQGRILIANPATIGVIGKPEAEIIGKTELDYLNRDQAIAIRENDRQVMETGLVQVFEETVNLPEGTRTFLSTKSPYRDEKGKIIGLIGVSADISDRKQLEQEREELLARAQAAREEAENANQTKDEFLAIVSHELRSPLNSILGWAKLLRTRTFEPAVVNRALETIERNAQNQCQLIEDLLDISRMIRGNLQLNIAPVNLNYVLETAINTVGPTAEYKQINLESRLDSTVGQVSGDLNRLQQIVVNLLNNAIKFTPAGGRVDVELSVVMGNRSLLIGDQNSQLPITNYQLPITNYVQITVRDTGKGISPDFLPYVFERFRRADSTTTRSKDGLGLGLAIVRHLVEMHGGTVKAESPGEGQGATFTVTLPLISCPVSAAPTSPAEAVSLTGIRVLIVDDEVDTREYLSFALNESGAIVETAASAREARAIFNQFKPDILVSDIGMPEEDGYSLIVQLRLEEAQKGEKQIPAIALTAYARKQDSDRAINAGFQRHITKPVEPAELVEAIASLIADRSI